MKLQKIELTNLDEILESHAYDFQRETESLPHLRRVMVEKKAFFEQTESRLYIEFRKMFENSGTKFTEGKLTAEIRVHQKFVAAQSAWFDAKEAYDEVDYLREIFMQRELSIKSLVSLYNAQYWSLSSIEKSTPTIKNKESKSVPKDSQKFKRRKSGG